MAAEHQQDAVKSATPESLERAGAEERPGRSDEPSGKIDGGADSAPGTVPEGATPEVAATPGDPLADAHE
jgi:hypothetical protein